MSAQHAPGPLPTLGDTLALHVAPALPRVQVWRLLTGVGLFGLFAILFEGIYLALAFASLEGLRPGEGIGMASARAERFLAGLQGDSRGMLVLLGSFSALWAALGVVLLLLHRRGFASLFGAGRRLIAGDFARGAAVALAISGTGIALFLAAGGVAERGDAAAWASLLLPALFLLLIQTGAEEAVFRGWLMQQIAGRWNSPALALLLPALAFGLVHWDGSVNAADKVGMAAAYGVLLGWITARTGNLSGAYGLHFGTNVAPLLLLGQADQMNGLALLRLPAEAGPSRVTVTEILWFGLVALAVWRVFRRRVPGA